MTYSFKKVLVTGGAGCIGVQVCLELIRRGIMVRLFDLHEQLTYVDTLLPPNAESYYGSILDLSSLRDAMADCDAVIHLAAYLGVRRTETNRLRCLEININGTRNVLDCAVQHGIKKIVFASSSEVYGEPFENPVKETTPTQGKTVYAVTKLAGEELCKAYAQRYPDLRYTILRYFNTYGPYQTAQFVIPKFIRNCMDGRPPIIYGDGNQIRSYCYSSDTAWATRKALLSKEADGEIMNIGNSENRANLSSLANLVITACGKQTTLKPKYQRHFSKTDRSADREIFERYCSISKAKDLLGFMPLVSLHEGIQKVLEHGVIFPKWGSTDVAYTLDDWF